MEEVDHSFLGKVIIQVSNIERISFLSLMLPDKRKKHIFLSLSNIFEILCEKDIFFSYECVDIQISSF